jgi:penicillin-binding protein-related factor A (putative recombinase)
LYSVLKRLIYPCISHTLMLLDSIPTATYLPSVGNTSRFPFVLIFFLRPSNIYYFPTVSAIVNPEISWKKLILLSYSSKRVNEIHTKSTRRYAYIQSWKTLK